MMNINQIESILNSFGGVFHSFRYILNLDYRKEVLEENLDQFKVQLIQFGLTDEDMEFIKYCKEHCENELSQEELYPWLENSLIMFTARKTREETERILHHFMGSGVVIETVRDEDVIDLGLGASANQSFIKVDISHPKVREALEKAKNFLDEQSDLIEKLKMIWRMCVNLENDESFENAIRRRERIVERTALFSYFLINKKGLCLPKAILAKLILQEISLKSFIIKGYFIHSQWSMGHAFLAVLINDIYHLFDPQNLIHTNGSSDYIIAQILRINEDKKIILPPRFDSLEYYII